MTPTSATIAGALSVLNAISFAMFAMDKRRSKIGARRISERALLISAVVSGTVGAWIGMRTFRHKTRKRSFIAAVLCMTAIDAIVAISLLLLTR
jgi:uncharacterized membrane protein YsdA (DUF1294 family)